VHHRLRRSLAGALFLLAAGVVVPIAQAAPKDAEAQKLDKQAMDEDYLNVQFDKAEEKLRKALNICGASGCDSKIKARIYMNLGIILVNARKQADAVAAFSEGLKLDPNASPNQDFTSDEVKKAFESARGSAPPPDTGTPGTSTPPPPAAGDAANDLAHDPIAEAQVDHPIPIYVGPQEGATRFLLYYKAPGADFTKVELKKMGKGYGAEIPCKDVKIAGKIKYYIQALDAQGDTVGGAGSKKQPLEIELKQKIAGDLPAFPGKDPPAKCKGGADCPPGMNEEGCEAKLSYGSKCTGPGQCSKADGLACIEGTCQPGKEGDGGDDGDDGDDGPPKLNLIWGIISVDDAIVSGSDICSSENSVKGTYVCFRQDKQDDKGNPRLYRGVNVNEKGSVSGPPFAIGTIRVLLGYDRAIPIKSAITPAVGVRLGYAFNGGPTVPNPTDGDKPFMPWHAEVRGTLFFGKNVLSKRGVRPYAFASGGLAQVDAKIANVPVSDDCANYDPSECRVTSDGKRLRIKVDAYRKMGTGFAALGGGLLYAVSKTSSIMVELKGALFFGSPGIAVSPSLGFVQQL
jgi:tetratricopeptide (TPR) repeat protein